MTARDGGNIENAGAIFDDTPFQSTCNASIEPG